MHIKKSCFFRSTNYFHMIDEIKVKSKGSKILPTSVMKCAQLNLALLSWEKKNL